MLNYKDRINHNFSKAAPDYDREAVFQKEMARLLAETIKNDNPNADSILDLGTGTGFLIDKISNIYPKAKIYGLDIASGMVETAANKFKDNKNISIIEGDIEALPFSENSFDLIISNASLQWLKDLKRAFKGINKILKKEGYLYANIFGERTFGELRSSMESMDLTYPFNFTEKNNLRDILKETGFTFQIHTEFFYKYYPDLMTFLKKVKEIGAGNISRVKNNLGQRKFLNDLEKEYISKYADKNGLKVTYEIINLKAEKSNG